jgi:hypothetical protein
MTDVPELRGEPALDALEQADIAFNPTTMHLDLDKEEKRRTTALLMAIQAYQHLIIKDGGYLRAAADLAQRGEGPTLHPATIDAMVEAALKFDAFIAGQLQLQASPPATGGAQTEAESAAEGKPASKKKNRP